MEEELHIADGAGPRALSRPLPGRELSAADKLRATEFPMALRGYDREAVDEFMAQVADLIETLEARQTRETVVQRALEEVGEETSAILKQAHESADDITARSRSQAEDRLEVARQEAAAITRDARLEADELKRSTQDLQAERASLIEELRRFAADTLAVADTAAERLDPAPLDEPPAEDGSDQHYEGTEEATAALAEPPVGETADPPYDSAEDIDAHEEWPAREDPADPPTDELPSLQEEPPPDEPPRAGA